MPSILDQTERCPDEPDAVRQSGNPTTTANDALCIYAGTASTLVGQSVIPASATKWSALGTTGYTFTDSAAGAGGSTPNKSKVQVKGKGAGLPDLPLPVTAPVIVQLVNGDNGLCWGTSYSAAQILNELRVTLVPPIPLAPSAPLAHNKGGHDGDHQQGRRVIALAGVLLLGGSAHAKTAVLKCQEAKLKAQGALQLCLKKNSAKVLGGKPDASAACKTKFSAALTKAGTACHYLDNGDGTVSDLNTGLQWEKKDNSADPHASTGIYGWSSSGIAADGDVYSFFLLQLNADASTDGGASTPITGCFAGHCDWRLPTIVELQGIVDATQGSCGGASGACIDPVFGPTQANGYWSATTDTSVPTHAWNVGSLFGNVDHVLKTNTLYVRAVRGGFGHSKPRSFRSRRTAAQLSVDSRCPGTTASTTLRPPFTWDATQVGRLWC